MSEVGTAADRSPLDEALEARGGESLGSAEGESLSILVFELEGEAFAFEGRYIKAVLPIGEVFFVPGCPPTLEGVILHQGEVESLIDISPSLGRRPLTKGKSRFILIGQSPAMRSGIRVDLVTDVLSIPESALIPTPVSIRQALRDLSTRAVEGEGGLVPLLDLPSVFAAWARESA